MLFPVRGMELPSLWEAINGRPRAMPRTHYDEAISLTWDFKDTLPAAKRVYYGKLLRHKPTLVSLQVLPYLYALSGNFGDLDDYLDAYADGRMSEPAKRVYEALLWHGPSPTSILRWRAGLGGKENSARFDRAITELQAGMHIVKTGISDANRWQYCYVYDLLPRWLPEVTQRAAEIKTKEAMQVVITKYLQVVMIATAPQMSRLFGWEPELTDRIVQSMIEAGLLKWVSLKGEAVPHLILSEI